MSTEMAAALVSVGAIALAEMGDKTQLLAMAFAVRFKAWKVLAGIFLATVLNHALAVAVGQLAGRVPSVKTVIVLDDTAPTGVTVDGDLLAYEPLLARDDIDAVIPPAERNAFMADYKSAAGFAMEALNRAPPTLPPGSRVCMATSRPISASTPAFSSADRGR
jgi:hypothetical protein